MHRRLWIFLICCASFTISSSIRCYTGTDRKCLLSSENGQYHRCAKYQIQCQTMNRDCDENEIANQQIKWIYRIVSDDQCQSMKSLYIDFQCCNTNGCNRPDHGKCSLAQARRRAIRRLTDVIELE